MKIQEIISYSKQWRNKINSIVKWLKEKENEYEKVIYLVRLCLKIYNVFTCSEICDFLLNIKKMFETWF